MSRYKYRIATALAALAAIALLASPVLAAYYVEITVTESDGNSYDMLPVSTSIDVDYLATNNFIETDGRDVRVKTAGGGDVPFMLVDDKVLFASPIAPDRQNAFRLSTGNSLIDNFSIVTGYTGYITTADHANLELADDFEIEFDGYLDATATTYPAVAATATSDGDDGSHTVDLPSGIESGDLLIVCFGAYEDTLSTHMLTFPAGWTEIVDEPTGDNRVKLGIAYRIADGGEGSSITVTNTGGSMSSAHNVYRITDYTGTPEVSTSSETLSATPDPPSLTPSWSTNSKTLWIVGFGGGLDSQRTLTSPPTDYGDELFLYQTGGSAESGHTGSARREYLTATQDAGVFTLSGSIRWLSFTIAVRGEGSAIVNKSGAFNIIFDSAGKLDTNIFGASPRTVSATGLTADAYTVKAYADGTDFKIDIDGSTEDTVALAGASVPDNANDWTIVGAYFNYYKHTTSDTLRLTYDPDDILIGTTLPNELAAGTYDGVITYGSEPSGISVAVGSLETMAVSYPTDAGASQDIIRPTTAPLFDVNMERLEHNPLRPVVVLIATEVNLTERLVWLGGGFFLLFAALILVLWKSEGQITFTAFAGLGVCIIMYLLGIFPLWPSIVFGIGAVAAFIWERVIAL